jgi:hypothetical protein
VPKIQRISYFKVSFCCVNVNPVSEKEISDVLGRVRLLWIRKMDSETGLLSVPHKFHVAVPQEPAYHPFM